MDHRPPVWPWAGEGPWTCAANVLIRLFHSPGGTLSPPALRSRGRRARRRPRRRGASSPCVRERGAPGSRAPGCRFRWMPATARVPPWSSAASATGTRSPTGAKRIAASSGTGGRPYAGPAEAAPSSSASRWAGPTQGAVADDPGAQQRCRGDGIGARRQRTGPRLPDDGVLREPTVRVPAGVLRGEAEVLRAGLAAQIPQVLLSQAMPSRSPGRNLRASSPVETTSPTTSWPGTRRGARGSRSHSLAHPSAHPAPSTRVRRESNGDDAEDQCLWTGTHAVPSVKVATPEGSGARTSAGGPG